MIVKFCIVGLTVSNILTLKSEETDGLYNEFRKKSQKEVNYLVKEFECRKSADAYARAGQSKTGVLDTSKLHTYRYNEEYLQKSNYSS